MSNSQFIASIGNPQLDTGNMTCQAPSNIALVKYWGKFGLQLPKNASISYTLSRCLTETTLHYSPRNSKTSTIDFEVFFEGKPAPHFHKKIETFFKRIQPYTSFINDYKFRIETKNTFPHSSGIASSASGMAALSYCIMELEKRLNPEISTDYFHQKASFLARLGSGSAARSIQGPMMIWGERPNLANSSNEYAIQNPFELHANFENYQDTILLVDKGTKQVSSSLGHDLMNHHPFAENRFKQANNNLDKLIHILKEGNLDEFIKLVESEALTLHAMMMTSSPYFLLMKPNTLEIINHIWNYREKTGNHLCFTLDAGANVHLLYPKSEKDETLKFIARDLAKFCQNKQYIPDEVGSGALVLQR